MYTARPFHDNIKETVVIITTCLYVKRVSTLPVDIVGRVMVRCINIYISAINGTNTLWDPKHPIEVFDFPFYSGSLIYSQCISNTCNYGGES